MNAEQKARKWLALYDSDKGHTAFKADAANIITALLKEREALLGAAKSAKAGIQSCLNMQYEHELLYQAITLCEKEHE